MRKNNILADVYSPELKLPTILRSICHELLLLWHLLLLSIVETALSLLLLLLHLELLLLGLHHRVHLRDNSCTKLAHERVGLLLLSHHIGNKATLVHSICWCSTTHHHISIHIPTVRIVPCISLHKVKSPISLELLLLWLLELLLCWLLILLLLLLN